MYLLLLIIGTLIYNKRFILLKHKENLMIESFIISSIINHIIIYIFLGNINMNYIANNITPSFFIKYLIMCIVGAKISYRFLNFIRQLKITKEKNFKDLIKIKNIITIIILIICIFAICLSNSFIKSYAKIPPEQLVFHLQVPISDSSSSVIMDVIRKPAIITGISSIIIITFYFINYLNISITSYYKKERIIKILPIKLKNYKINLICIITLILTILNLFNKIDISSFIVNQFKESKFISENYIDPNAIEINFPSKKQNLIYIYLESMESTNADFNNGGNYAINYIPNLTKLAKENVGLSINNNNFYEITGANWTIASMVSQTSGLPLKFSVDSSSYNASKNVFLDGITTLGEILENNGYKNYLYIGSNADFAARRTYFTNNGNYNVFDYISAEEDIIDNDYFEFWGYEDKKLYEYSKEKISEISKLAEPFNFTLLTVDTHAPEGYLDESCKNDYDTQLENVISCADDMVYDFIKWIQKQDFYKNTTIIVVGDHLFMSNNSFYKEDNRYVYATIINPNINMSNINNRNFSALDMFPTTIAALGANIKGEKLGLGVNLFSEEKTLIEKFGYEYVNEELKKKSTYYKNITLYNEKD